MVGDFLLYAFLMNFLLIDNGTTLLRQLERAIPGKCDLYSWNEIRGVKLSNFDGIILSGGSLFEIVGHESWLKDEIRLIHDAKKLLIGICFGCELLADTFGGRLERDAEDHAGITQIRVLHHESIFNSQEQFSVYEHHRWLVKELPECFEVLAESDHGIEMFRHKSRPMYGLQFHPEHFERAEDGERILLNILNEELN